MSLRTITYPQLTHSDHNLIQSYRQKQNTLYNVIAPHFTIVFSVPGMEVADFVEEIRKQSAGTQTIPFCLRCAVVNKDAFSNNYDAFLVPDEGFSQIIKLHDRLYSGTLAQHHRLDIPYIPHISIANSPDVQVIKKIVDEINEQGIEIQGTISSLHIINYENRVVTTIEQVQLLG